MTHIRSPGSQPQFVPLEAVGADEAGDEAEGTGEATAGTASALDVGRGAGAPIKT
jgi:hypothetical protein